MSVVNNKTFIHFVGFFTLIACWLKMTANLDLFQDLLATDEAYYMIGGVTLKGKMLKYWGPSYSLWYTIQALFERDTIKLYYLNQKVVTIVPVLLCYIMLLRFRIKFVISLLLPFFLLISLLYFPTWPKISHFCIAVVFASVIVSQSLNSNFSKWLTFSFAAFVLAYARPEFHLSVLMFIGVLLVWVFIKKFKLSKVQWLFVLLFFFLYTAASSLLGNIFIDSDSDRNIVAFAQHFSYNYAVWNNMDIRNWMDYDNIFAQHFGTASSYGEVIKSNAPMFFKHIFSNLREYFYALYIYATDIILPEKIFNLAATARLILILISIFVLIVLSRNTYFFERVSVLLRENLLTGAALLLLTLPTFISVILIFPRNHYLILQLPLFIFLITILFHKTDSFKLSNIRVLSVVILGGILFLITPKASDFEYFNFWKGEQNTNNLKAIRIMKQLSQNNEVRTTQSEGALGAFVLSKNFSVIQAADFQNFEIMKHIEDSDINLVYCSTFLLKSPFIKRGVEEWEYFIHNPEEAGWKKVILTEGSREFLLVRNDLAKHL
jgi:hypothetical protein